MKNDDEGERKENEGDEKKEVDIMVLFFDFRVCSLVILG